MNMTARKCTPSAPVDLVHLSTYTLGNADLEAELLGLYREQARRVLVLLEKAADGTAWLHAAHSLTGSARGVGAWPVAEAAAAAEKTDFNDAVLRSDALAKLRDAVEIVDAFLVELDGSETA